MNEKDDDLLADALNVHPIEKINETQINYPVVDPKNQADIDMEHVRQNLYELIVKGTVAADNALNVAGEMQHPRAYEVAGNLIKNVGDLTDKLVNLHKAKSDINKTVEKNNVNIDKAVIFNGSTAELLKMIKNESNNT